MKWNVCAIGFGLLMTACAAQPVMTRVIYEDRAVWVRLEKDPDVEKIETKSDGSRVPITSGMLAGWMRGFRVQGDRGPVGMLMMQGTGEVNAFVDPEIAALTPHLAKGLKDAGPSERVAYCMTVDWDANERFITTGWIFAKGPYLYFRIQEYRTPIRVASPAVPTADACRTKPIPGYRTSDRFVRFGYQPSEALVQHGSGLGLLAGADMNGRGEMVFQLSRLYKLGAADQKSR